MSIYEVLGMGYVVAATATFTAEVIYFAAKGLIYLQRLVQRAQTEEILDLERSVSIKRELANTEYSGVSAGK